VPTAVRSLPPPAVGKPKAIDGLLLPVQGFLAAQESRRHAGRVERMGSSLAQRSHRFWFRPAASLWTETGSARCAGTGHHRKPWPQLDSRRARPTVLIRLIAAPVVTRLRWPAAVACSPASPAGGSSGRIGAACAATTTAGTACPLCLGFPARPSRSAPGLGGLISADPRDVALHWVWRRRQNPGLLRLPQFNISHCGRAPPLVAGRSSAPFFYSSLDHDRRMLTGGSPAPEGPESPRLLPSSR